MSDTIKNVRLKDKDGNILHPEITVDTELNSTSENPVQNKVINAKLDEVFQSVSNSNTRIETAITDMGGTVSKSGSVAKTGELISGLATISSVQANIFVQETEPESKNGLWLKTSNTYDDIVNVNGIENTVSYTKMKDTPYEFYYGNGSVALDDNIYIIGSMYNSGGHQKLYKYNTSNDVYTELTNLPDPALYKGSSSLVGTNIFIFGDLHATTQKCNYKYNTLTDTYTKKTDIPYAFNLGSAVSVDSNIYLLGGRNNKTNNYKYNTLTDTYTKMADIPYEFYEGSAVSINSDIYLLGSIYQESSESKYVYANYNYKYNTLTDTYTKMADIPYEFYEGSAVVMNNNIYLLGSKSVDYTNCIYEYNITKNSYTQLLDIPYEFYEGSAVTINNKIYLLGGEKSQKSNYRIDFTILDKNSIVFLNADMSFKHKTKMFNTPYGVLNYINFDSVIMTDENGNNANVEVYIGNCTEWTKIS